MNIALFVAQCCPGKEPLQESLPPARQGGFDADAIAAEFAGYIKKSFQYNLCEWEPDNKYYPKYLLLGGDKGILAYAVFNYAEGDTFQKEDLAMPLHDTIKIVRYAS